MVRRFIGGLGSTRFFAALGFRTSLPPVRLVEKFYKDILTLLGFYVGPQPLATEKRSDQVLRDRKEIGVSSLLWTA